MTYLSTAQNRHKRYIPAVKPFVSLLSTIRYLSRDLGAKWKLIKQIRSERRTLSHLSDYQLRDIGLTRDQVNQEVSRSIFDTPQRYSESMYQQNGTREPRRPRINRLPKD